MKIAIVQINPLTGDLSGNAEKIISGTNHAGKNNADVCITPALALTGNPAYDLLLDNDFLTSTCEQLQMMAARLAQGPALLVGLPLKSAENTKLLNSVALLRDGKIEKYFHKIQLDTDAAFNESRYFQPSPQAASLNWFQLNNKKIAVHICNDIWPDTLEPLHNKDISTMITESAPDILINIAASPFCYGKQQQREQSLRSLATKHNLPTIYVNQVGGNDELIFEGHSLVFDNTGRLTTRCTSFAQAIEIVDLEEQKDNQEAEYDFCPESEIWQALVLGLGDYVRKCKFKKVILGLSGGIDSALSACIAAEATGVENVMGVLMPSPYSSQGSITDSHELAKNLNIQTTTIPIKPLMDCMDNSLAYAFRGLKKDVTEENIQARLRANLLMALANKHNALLLSTSNKSETAAGYCTLYGDMSGALAPIADLPKSLVYSLSHWINKNHNCFNIPENILTKAPSAELGPDQKDTDSLPDYDTLDAILQDLLDNHKPVSQLIKEGQDPQTVHKIAALIKKSEFKRYQSPPGLKISSSFFAKDRKMPVVRF